LNLRKFKRKVSKIHGIISKGQIQEKSPRRKGTGGGEGRKTEEL
jgi:hypothetical protein